MISASEPQKEQDFHSVRDEFVAQWGAISSSWGINRTMAQIHALLMVSPAPMFTDEIMDLLQISRGNAHGNLKELVNWGIVKSVYKKGDRKEYFEAEKDVWRMFCTITRERKRREIDPALEVLKHCAATTVFTRKWLHDFAKFRKAHGEKWAGNKFGDSSAAANVAVNWSLVEALHKTD